jgi:isopentenyl phosphate kinase
MTQSPITQSLTVVKLGGALLTDKQEPFTLRTALLQQVADELKGCLDSGLLGRLLLVHGVGSFGHPPVVQYKLHKGLQSPSQLIHLTYVQNCVLTLRQAIAEACHRAGLAVATILPSSCMTADSFVATTHFYDAITGFLDLGMIPLLGGDVLADRQMGFAVYSGDRLAVDLALHFGADRLIFATAVDGIYEQDPVQHPAAKRIEQLSLRALDTATTDLDRRQQIDASGAMAGKLEATQRAQEAIAAGLHVHVISMMQPGNLPALLSGQRVGTQLVA